MAEDNLHGYIERDPRGGNRWWVEEDSSVILAEGWEFTRDEAVKAARRALDAIRHPQREEIQ